MLLREVQGVGEVLDDVTGIYAGVVFALDPAAEPADRDLGIASASNRGEETLFADGAGDVVVFRLVPEAAGHSAATAIDFGGPIARRDIQ